MINGKSYIHNLHCDFPKSRLVAHWVLHLLDKSSDVADGRSHRRVDSQKLCQLHGYRPLDDAGVAHPIAVFFIELVAQTTATQISILYL